MKKTIAFLTVIILLVGLLSACGNSLEEAEGKISIVTTIFPEYDWVCRILGDNAANVKLTLLTDDGVDMHSYRPTADDIIEISTCDMLICVGGESDEWLNDALENSENKAMRVVKLTEAVGGLVPEEKAVEEMQHGHKDAEHKETDEHVWLSLKNAETICRRIAKELSELDYQNADEYSSNAEAYIAELEKLDEDYRSTVETAAFNTLLFADRFPFRYLTEDYGINYFAAFSGCSAETEASFATITFLADKADELGLTSVLVIDGSDKKLANTVIENSAFHNRDVLVLNSMQSVTMKDVLQGTTYLSVMRSNLEVLRKALN